MPPIFVVGKHQTRSTANLNEAKAQKPMLRVLNVQQYFNIAHTTRVRPLFAFREECNLL